MLKKKEKIPYSCPKCGSTKFLVTEHQSWDGELSPDEEGIIDCTDPCAEVKSITCKKCNHHICPDKVIGFNFC